MDLLPLEGQLPSVRITSVSSSVIHWCCMQGNISSTSVKTSLFPDSMGAYVVVAQHYFSDKTLFIDIIYTELHGRNLSNLT